jgi:hypothetical protein
MVAKATLATRMARELRTGAQVKDNMYSIVQTILAGEDRNPVL